MHDTENFLTYTLLQPIGMVGGYWQEPKEYRSSYAIRHIPSMAAVMPYFV